jgi:hypothetical protein
MSLVEVKKNDASYNVTISIDGDDRTVHLDELTETEIQQIGVTLLTAIGYAVEGDDDD